jgi:exopolysaccharide biosynthesis protein
MHRLHWLRIDMQQADLQLVLTPQPCAGLRLPELDKLPGVLASVNASFFTKEFFARGHTVSSGKIWQNNLRLTEGPTLACTKDRQCQILHKAPSETSTHWTQASSGVHSLVVHGIARRAEEDQSCPTFCETTHPRTAVGMDATGQWMVWVVAEGRQKNVEGLALSKFAQLIQAQGISEAINLDGGGSTAMHVLGQPRTARPDNELNARKIANAWVVMDQSSPTDSLTHYCQNRPTENSP